MKTKITVCILLSLLLSFLAKGEEVTSTFIKNETVIDKGFISTFKQDGRNYLIIPESILGRDILVTITILKGSAHKERNSEMRFGYGGDSMFEKVLRFGKNRNKIEFQNPQFVYNGDNKSIYDKYFDEKIDEVSLALDILDDSNSEYIIDVTDIIDEDYDIFSLKGVKEQMKLGGYRKDLSHTLGIRAFPQNINFTTIKYYAWVDPKNNYDLSAWELSACWFLLPEKPMKPRLSDSRIGYFTKFLRGVNFWNDRNSGLSSGQNAATRWRLEPKPEDMEKYFKGELVEPQKPIVFYIDRATPEYLKPHFIEAVEKWQIAFESAGFKNAILAKIAPTPEEDPYYCEGDIRYNLVSYKASPIPNAYGPMVTDPRSGEIITSHIAIFHSVQDLLQRWYFVMCGTVDPRARIYPLPEDIMAELVATVLTHEVGHTLGLMHDFLGSTVYPVDSLRNRDFIRKHGYGASIMDYQRFNYVAQPEDNLEPQDLMPSIGVYDKYAIEWGYRYYDESIDVKQETEMLRLWTTEQRKNPALIYISERENLDPRVQAEDFGDDVIKANLLGLRNLKTIMDNLEDWTQSDDITYFPLRRRYLSVISQYQNYINHILKVIGGRYVETPDFEEDLILYKNVPAAKQEEALQFIVEHLLIEPKWLYQNDLMEKTRIDFNFHIHDFVRISLGKMIIKSNEIIKAKEFTDDAFSYEYLLETIYNAIFNSHESDKILTRYERMLQNEFVTQLTINAENLNSVKNGAGFLYQNLLMKIKNKNKELINKNPESIMSGHYRGLASFITVWENGKNESILKTL